MIDSGQTQNSFSVYFWVSELLCQLASLTGITRCSLNVFRRLKYMTDRASNMDAQCSVIGYFWYFKLVGQQGGIARKKQMIDRDVQHGSFVLVGVNQEEDTKVMI